MSIPATGQITGFSLYNPATNNSNLLPGVKTQKDGATKVAKPDITKQVQDLDMRIKGILGDRHTASTYTNKLNGHQGKATVDILNINYKQLMETANDPNLSEAKRTELKGLIQDIRNIGDSLENSGWYKSNPNPALQQGSKISVGLGRYADVLEKQLNAASLKPANAGNAALNRVLDGDSELMVSDTAITPQTVVPVLRALVTEPELNKKIDAATSWRDVLNIAQAQIDKLPPTSTQSEALQKFFSTIKQAASEKAAQP